jgi:two-component system chemotaxis sensor kinase CheA
MGMSMVVDGELLDTFREETSERLDRIVQTLLAIEARGADPELISTLFRDAHSIKGNAGMLGFGEAQEIAHAMEDVIQAAVASGSLAPGLVNPLLAAGDAIREVVAGATGLASEAVAALRAESGDATVPVPAATPDVASRNG